MQRACGSCGQTYEAKRPSSTYCGERCRKRAQRGAVVTDAKVTALEPQSTGAGPVEEATRSELDTADRSGTALGQVAVALARRLDASGGDTGAGLASLAKQLEATLMSATADSKQVADPIDELRSWRDRKRAAAG